MADKKLALVPDWRHASKWASMWWSGAGFLISTISFLNEIWGSLDHHIQDRFTFAPVLGMVLFCGTMAGRLLVWVHDEVSEHADHENSDSQ